MHIDQLLLLFMSCLITIYPVIRAVLSCDRFKFIKNLTENSNAFGNLGRQYFRYPYMVILSAQVGM